MLWRPTLPATRALGRTKAVCAVSAACILVGSTRRGVGQVRGKQAGLLLPCAHPPGQQIRVLSAFLQSPERASTGLPHLSCIPPT